MRSIIAIVIATGGYGLIALAAPSTATADECPAGYYWSKAHAACVERPDNNPVGAVAQCADGNYSHSESRSGTCSENGGISRRCPCDGSAVSAPHAAPAPDPSVLIPSVPKYLDDLQKSGITYASEGGAIQDGRQVCDEIANGADFATVEQIAVNLTGLNLAGAAHVIIASGLYLCPAVDDNGIVDKAMDLAYPD